MLDLVNLRLDFVRHLGVRVAHADRHDAAQKVEKLLALGVPNVLALGMVDHHRVLEVGGDTVEKVFLLFANDFVVSHGSPFVLTAYNRQLTENGDLNADLNT